MLVISSLPAELPHARCRHQVFVHMVRQHCTSSSRQPSDAAPAELANGERSASEALSTSSSGKLPGRAPTRPADLPIYRPEAKSATT